MHSLIVLVFSVTVSKKYDDCRKRFNFSWKNENFVFFDFCTSTLAPNKTFQFCTKNDGYKIWGLDFKPKDVVIDVGGNCGIFSILLAKKYPFLKIYSFEPVLEAYENFKRNIEANNISEGVITLVNKAVTGDGRDVKMMVDPKSWGSRVDGFKFKDQFLLDQNVVESVTIDGIFKEFGISTCKLLKVNCEGCEYETLFATSDAVFKRIEVFRGTTHKFDGLLSRGFTPEKLRDFVRSKNLKDFDVIIHKSVEKKDVKKSDSEEAKVAQKERIRENQAKYQAKRKKFREEVSKDQLSLIRLLSDHVVKDTEWVTVTFNELSAKLSVAESEKKEEKETEATKGEESTNKIKFEVTNNEG